MPRRVYVTGTGIITSVGCGTDETLDALQQLRTGIGKLSLFPSIHDDIPIAGVPYDHEGLCRLTGTDPQNKKLTRNTLLALIAAQQALDHAGTARETYWPSKTAGSQATDSSRKSGSDTEKGMGLVLATTVGGMDLNERHYLSLLQDDRHKDLIEVFDSADCTEKVAARYGIHDFVTTISTACSSSANSIMLAARMIQSGKLDRVLAGGTDALTRFTLNGFLALEILSPTGCRPFDKNRNGLTIGEGAAMLVLEAGDVADPSTILCEVTGYANVNEAYHQTASSPEGTGAFMAMQKAIGRASLQPSDISYINAHGTGTEINDLAEGRAIQRLFGDKIPPVSSTKAFTGHTLGAAGAVEAVLSVLAIGQQAVLPSLNLDTPMEEIDFVPARTYRAAEIRHVISNSFGFGGNNTSLVFSKV